MMDRNKVSWIMLLGFFSVPTLAPTDACMLRVRSTP